MTQDDRELANDIELAAHILSAWYGEEDALAWVHEDTEGALKVAQTVRAITAELAARVVPAIDDSDFVARLMHCAEQGEKGSVPYSSNFFRGAAKIIQARDVDIATLQAKLEAAEKENERLREENARLSGLAGKPYYFAPGIDDECAADEVKLVMEDVPIGEVQEIEVHRRTGFIYAVWMCERSLLEFSSEEEARAALSAADAREGE